MNSARQGTTAKYQFITVSHIRNYAKQHNRRVGHDFLRAFDNFIAQKLGHAVTVRNAGKKTLDRFVADWILTGGRLYRKPEK